MSEKSSLDLINDKTGAAKFSGRSEHDQDVLQNHHANEEETFGLTKPDIINEVLRKSKEEEIKAAIGQAFLDVLIQVTFRRILKRPPQSRTRQEINRLKWFLKRRSTFK